MAPWRALAAGVRNLLDARGRDRDASDEVDDFVAQAAAAHVARGMEPDEAHRAALLEMGNATSVKEDVRGAGWESAVESFVSDLRYAGRMLRKSPVFSAVVILVVSLGTGAVTTTFSATNAMLLRPLPGAAAPGSLFSIDRKHRNGKDGMSASYPFYEQVRDKTRSFDGVAAWHDIELTVSIGGAAVNTYGNVVSGNYFTVLGVRPELGRLLLPGDDRVPLTDPVMVISDGFWRAAFGADSSVVGRAVRVNGHPFTIVGVVPPSFRSVYVPVKSDAWVPVMMLPQLRPGHALNDPSDILLKLFARLKNGVSRESARQEVSALTAAWVASGAEPMSWSKDYVDARLVPLTGLPEDATRAIAGFFFLLLGASALVLLIASVNVAAMLSARAVARRREMAVRAALGARRGRLVRQMLTESLVLFLCGALGGIAIAAAATRALQHLPVPDVISLDLAPDYRVVGFALVMSLAAGVLFGLVPALQASRPDLAKRIRDESPAGGGRRGRVADALVVGQLSLSLLLLVAAGLFLRALQRGSRVDPGFVAAGVSTAPLNTESWGYDEARGRAFYAALRERMESTPGVSHVSFTNVTPLTGSSSGGTIHVDGADEPGAGGAVTPGTPVRMANVDAEFFGALRIPVVEGVPIGRNDDVRSQKVAVINETLARRIAPDGNALGRTFTYGGGRITIVGVARDAKYAWLSEDRTPFVYFPIAQVWVPKQVLLVRATLPSGEVRAAIQRAVRSIDPGLPPPVVTTLRQENGIVLLPQRVAAMVTGVLGGIGLLLATVGLYGVISYSVSRRAREIGIRVALGARQADVLGLVVREGMRLAALGMAIGLALSAAATRLMAGFLFSVSPLDLVTFAGMTALLLAIALVSSYLPARRAARSDPMTALRTE